MTPSVIRAAEAAAQPIRRGIYVHEGKAFVGPFATHKDAQHFIRLIELFGESTEGIEVLDLRTEDPEPGEQFCCH
jgi:hypothetical protein